MRYCAPDPRAAALRPDLNALHAAAKGMRLWLSQLALWLIEFLAQFSWTGVEDWRQDIRADLRANARHLRQLIFWRAFARLDLRVAPKPTRRPRHHPPGFRVQRIRDSNLRRITRAAFRGLHAGTIEQRIARQREILDHPEPLIARVLARIARGLRAHTLAPTAPPPILFSSDSPAPTPAIADSS